MKTKSNYIKIIYLIFERILNSLGSKMIYPLNTLTSNLCITNELPILTFLNQKSKRKVKYIKFSVQEVQLYPSHTIYRIEVNEFGKIWIMEIRYSVLLEFYQKLKKNYEHLKFPKKFYIFKLSTQQLKKRATEIQLFLTQIGSNYSLVNSDEMKQFLMKQLDQKMIIKDYSEIQNFDLNC